MKWDHRRLLRYIQSNTSPAGGRQWLVLCCLLTTLFVAGCGPQGYPSRSATIICPWSAGGGTDRVARYWAAALEREFDSPFVVVNRTGGNGSNGHSSGAQARPDGHTLTLITFELCTMHQIGVPAPTFEDFECLLQFNADPAAVIVRNDAPWQTLEEFLADVKAKSDAGEKLKMSGTATAAAWDLARAGMLRAAEMPADSTIWVPTEGSAPSLVELLGGHIDAVCCSVPEAAAQLEAGQLRVLAVMSEERLPDYPEIPTLLEQGIDWVAVGWRGLALPKNTPPEILELLKEKCLAIAESEDFREFMNQNRFGIEVRPTDEFKGFLQQQDEQWGELIKAAGYANS